MKAGYVFLRFLRVNRVFQRGDGYGGGFSQREISVKPRHSSDLPPTASTFPTGGTTCPSATWQRHTVYE